MVPFGFENLVKMIEDSKEWETPTLVNNDEDMWYNFCWAAMLMNVKEADVDYCLGILDDAGLTERRSLNSDWMNEAANALSEAESEITDDDVNSTGKGGAIKKIMGGLSGIDDSLKSADMIFNRRKPKINASYLRSIANNTEAESNLIAELASKDEASELHKVTTHRNKIIGVAYTKTVLWLHGCGLALNHIPDNSHSKKFLKECGENMTSPDFYVVNFRFKKICDKSGINVYYSGLALWLYQSSKSLIHGRKKELFTPHIMMKIMKDNHLSIVDVADMLGDIELVCEWEEMLNSAMERLFL